MDIRTQKLLEKFSELFEEVLSKKEREAAIAKLEKEMREASKRLEFEYAAVLRDRIIELRGHG